MRLKSFSYNRKGFTIVEMVVATSVLAMFVVLALGSVIPGLRVTKQAEESLAAQREIVLAFDRLVKEMSSLDRATVSVAPDVLSFVSDEPHSGGNSAIANTNLMNLTAISRKVLQKNVLLHRSGDNLLRREYPYAHGNNLYRIIDTQLPVIASSGATEKLFAKGVELFEPTIAGRSRVYLRVRSVHRKTGNPTACELTLQVQMRGGI